MFYNCGVDSGASQSHKHIQVIVGGGCDGSSFPTTPLKTGRLHLTNSWRESLFQVTRCASVLCIHSITSCIPFRPSPILVQLYHFSHVDELYQHYSEMVEHMTKVRQSEGKKMESYNFLLFKKWLMLVPRTRVGLLIVSELLGDVEFNQY